MLPPNQSARWIVLALTSVMLLVMATGAYAATSPSILGLSWARLFNKEAFLKHLPVRITEVGCAEDKDGIVLCAVTLHNRKTGAEKCVGVEPGPNGVLFSAPIPLPPKYCGIKKKFTA